MLRPPDSNLSTLDLLKALFCTFLQMLTSPPIFPFFFFNDTATTEIYTLSLHDALPISYYVRVTSGERVPFLFCYLHQCFRSIGISTEGARDRSHRSRVQLHRFLFDVRSEEHTS